MQAFAKNRKQRVRLNSTLHREIQTDSSVIRLTYCIYLSTRLLIILLSILYYHALVVLAYPLSGEVIHRLALVEHSAAGSGDDADAVGLVQIDHALR